MTPEDAESKSTEMGLVLEDDEAPGAHEPASSRAVMLEHPLEPLPEDAEILHVLREEFDEIPGEDL